MSDGREGARYFTAPDGTTYRVLDTRWHRGRRLIANPPVPWASTRVFRAEDGRERFIAVGFLERIPNWSPEPTDELLALAFARSERGRGWPGRTLAERAAENANAPTPVKE